MNQDNIERVKYPLLEEIAVSWSGLGNLLNDSEDCLKDLLKEMEQSNRENNAAITAAENRILEAKSSNKDLALVMEFIHTKTKKETLSYLDDTNNQVVSIKLDGQINELEIERIDINIP